MVLLLRLVDPPDVIDVDELFTVELDTLDQIVGVCRPPVVGAVGAADAT